MINSARSGKFVASFGRKISKAALMMMAVAPAALLFSSHSALAATDTWDGGGADNNWKTAANWTTDIAPTPGDILAFDGSARFSSNNNFANNTLFTGLIFDTTATAPFTLTGNIINLNGNITDLSQSYINAINLNLALQSTTTINVASFGSLTISGILSGVSGAGFVKTGAGTLTLTGVNSFSGPITLNAGVLSVNTATELGASSATSPITINGGTIRATGNIVIPTLRPIVLGPTSGTGSGTFDVATGIVVTYGGVISDNGTPGAGSLIKTSFGNLTLTGKETYTGATVVKNGSLILDYGNSTVTTNIINSASTLTLGGATAGIGQNNNATLSMIGKASGTDTESFAATNIDIYGSVINVVNGATGGTSKLNLGALTDTVGGTVVISTNGTPATNTGSVTNMGTVTTTTTVATTHGILGGWAIAGAPTIQRGITLGTDWATVGPDNGDGTHNIIAYTGYVTAPAYDGSTSSLLLHNNPAILANADKNLLFTGATSSQEMRVDVENAGTTTDINTLAYTTNGANHTLTIGSGNTLRLGVYGGILKRLTGNNQLYIGGTGGVQSGNGAAGASGVGNLTAGGPTDNTPGEIVLDLAETANNNGTLNIEANIVDNGTGAVTVIKNGVSSVKIDGHNTFSGGLFITQGRFQLAGSEVGSPNPDGLGTGTVTIAPGAYLYVSGVNGNATSPILYTGRGAIPGAIVNTAQNAPITNDMVISGIGTNQEGIGAIRLGNKAILSGQITLGGDARIGNGTDRSFPAINTDGVSLYLDPGHLLSGKITGAFNLDWGSAASVATNFMVSNSANDYSGNTTFISGGGATRIRLAGDEVIPDGVGKGNLVWGAGANSATLDLNGHQESVNGLSTALSTNLAGDFIENEGFNATITGDPGAKSYVFTGITSVFKVGGFDQTATFGGVIRDFDPAATVALPDPNSTPGTVAVATVTVSPWASPTTGSASKIAVTKNGTGTQTFSGANSYSGDTNVNSGAISVTGSLLNTGIVNINTSAASSGSLFGTGSVGNVVTAAINSGHRAVINPGATGAGSAGTLTMTSLSAGAGTDLQFDLGTTSDSITVNGPVTFNAASTITPTSVTPGTYTVLNASSITGTIPTLISTGDTRLVYAYDSNSWTNIPTNNSIIIDVTGTPATLTWTGASDGSTWDLHITPNWTSTAPVNPNLFFNADAVTFSDSGLANSDISLGGLVQPGSVSVTNNSGNYSISGGGSIGGSGSLTKTNNGTLTLATNNSYSGGTIMSGGTLNINNNSALGSGAFILNAGTIDNTSGSPVVISGNIAITLNNDILFTGSNNLDLGTGTITQGNLINGANRTITVGGSTLTISGNIGDGPNGNNGLVKAGSGTLALNGANSFSGPVTINVGTLVTGNFSALGSNTSTGTTIASGAMLDIGGDATANDANGFGSMPFTIAGTGVGGLGVIINSSTTAQQNAFQNISLAADATIGGTGRFDIRGGSPVLNLNSHTLTKIGTNQFSLVGVTVGAGNIVVNQGIFSVEAASTMTDDSVSTFIVNDGATVQFFDNTGTVNRPITLNGNTKVNDSSGTGITSPIASPFIINGTVTVSSNSATATLALSGLLSNATGSLIVAGPGTLSLQNPTNTFGGGTTLNGGTLNFADIGSLGSGPLTFNGGTIQWTGGNADDISNLGITLNAGGGTFDTNGNTITLSKNISGPGGLSAIANGPLTLTGTNTYGGSTAVQTGNLIAGTAASIPAGTNVILGNATTNSGGTLDVNGFNLTIGGLNSLGVGSNTIGSSSTANNVTLTFAGTTPSTFAGNITDSVNGGSRITSLTVTAGTLTLTGSNSYSGTTTVNGGTLTMGANGFLNSNNVSVGTAGTFTVAAGGSIPDSTTLTANGTVNFNNPTRNLATLNSTTGGSINLNTTTLTVNNGGSYVGTIQDNGTSGKLVVPSSTTLGTGAVNLATLEVDGKHIITSSAPSKINTLSLAGSYGGSANAVSTWTGTLDLTNSKLIVQDTSDPVTRAADLAQLKNEALASNSALGTVGIVSSTANAFNTAAGKVVKVVAVVDNGVRIATFPAGSTNFGGVNNVNSNSILIEATFKGDANLDGVVDIQDLTDVANHWQQTVTDWSQGDFDGSNFVDISDLTSIANNWQAGVGSSSSLSVMPSFTPPVATPEPTSLALLTLGGLLLTKRRRK